jgi:hypothetical protein
VEGSLSGILTSRRRLRAYPHTPRALHDTIGLSSVTATGITIELGMLVTTQYGQPASRVHVLRRRVADGHETKVHSKRSRRTGERDTCHNAAHEAAVQSPTRVTLEQVTTFSVPFGRDRRSAAVG